MVKKIRHNGRLSYNQPKLFSAKKEKETGSTINPYFFIRVILLLLIAGLVLYFIFFSNFFIIKDVLVEGNQLIQKDKIVYINDNNEWTKEQKL